MSTARLCLRLVALTAWTGVLFAAWLLGAPVAIFAGASWRWRVFIRQSWSRGVCRIVGVRLVVDGRAPGGPCLMVSNHVSYLDAVVLGSLVPCSFVAQHEIARWPVLGFLARAMGTQFVDRGNKRELSGLNRRLHARLVRGETLLVFPEGTSTSGADVLPFRPALLAPAVALGSPVSYAALSYATPDGERPASEVVCWWGGMTFLPHAHALLRLPWIEARVCFGSEPISAPDRKQLAALLHDAVVELLRPLRVGVSDRRSSTRAPCAEPGAELGASLRARTHWDETCAPQAG